jgi:hypothetical protein
MYPLPGDPATDPLIRARAWIFKVLRERPDNAHHRQRAARARPDPGDPDCPRTCRTDLAGDEWIEDHERVARVLDGDVAGALVVNGLAEAFVRAVRRG